VIFLTGKCKKTPSWNLTLKDVRKRRRPASFYCLFGQLPEKTKQADKRPYLTAYRRGTIGGDVVILDRERSGSLTSFTTSRGAEPQRPLGTRRSDAVYWQPENDNVAALTLVQGVTVSAVLVTVELVWRPDGLQSSVPPPPGTNARASTV
jgi:hypothetical protein